MQILSQFKPTAPSLSCFSAGFGVVLSHVIIRIAPHSSVIALPAVRMSSFLVDVL